MENMRWHAFGLFVLVGLAGAELRAEEPAVGFARNGALHVGEIHDVAGEAKMHSEVVIEYYTMTDHWRIQRPNDNRGWESHPATLTEDEPNAHATGMIGYSDWELSFERARGDHAFDLTWQADGLRAADHYRALNELGVVVGFDVDDGVGLTINGEDIDYAAASDEKLDEMGGDLETLRVMFPSGRAFVLTEFDGLTNWAIATHRGTVLVRLQSPEVEADDIAFAFTLAGGAERVARVDASAFEFQRDHDGWFVIEPPESLAFVDSPSFNFADLSEVTLDPPAGKHGFLEVRDGQFYFENGTGPVRFGGVTLVHGSKFPTKEEAELLAERIAKMGCNLVRLHHIDYHRPGFGLFDREQMEASTRTFDDELIDRMDYLIYQLKKRGVYIHMDGVTARRFREDDDVPAWDSLTFGMKGSAYVYESDILRRKQKSFLERLWTHENPYTGMAYKDDPAIATAEIINENDLFTHGTLDHHFPEPYRSKMEGMFERWLNAHDLPTYSYSGAPREVRSAFYLDTMRDYYRLMYGFLRDLGVRAPLTGTNWIHPGSSIGVYAAQHEMDYSAAHPYGREAFFQNPPNVAGSRAGLLALSRMADKPLVHNEWNMHNTVGITRVASILYQVALMASAGHDGSYLFALFHHHLDYDARHIDSRNVGFDPAVRALYPAAALLLIRGDMATPDFEFAYRPGIDSMLPTDDRPGITRETRDQRWADFSRAAYFGSVVIDYSNIPFGDSPFNIERAFTDDAARNVRRIEGGSPQMRRMLPPEDEYPARNFSGELVSYWEDGYFLVKTPRSKWAVGYLPGDQAMDLGDGVRVRLEESQFACITISSLDDEPIAESEHLMIGSVSYIEQPRMYFDRKWRHPENLARDAAIVCQPVRAHLSLPGGSGRVLQAKSPVNEVLAEHHIEAEGGDLPVVLDEDVLVYELITR